jgi:hypothetical protein
MFMGMDLHSPQLLFQTYIPPQLFFQLPFSPNSEIYNLSNVCQVLLPSPGKPLCLRPISLSAVQYLKLQLLWPWQNGVLMYHCQAALHGHPDLYFCLEPSAEKLCSDPCTWPFNCTSYFYIFSCNFLRTTLFNPHNSLSLHPSFLS